MKKRTIATLVVLALFALTIAAFAYTKTNNVVADKACCCKSGDSCPMKSKGHDDKGGEHAKMSCCAKHGDDHAKGGDHAKAEGHECCGDSCPMKKKDGATATATSATTTVAATTTTEGHSCCGCCGDSCSMKKKDGATSTTATDNKSCCDDCDCCKEKAKTQTKTSV